MKFKIVARAISRRNEVRVKVGRAVNEFEG
jgi:hypothetical protein